jgi:LysR family transcriptional regulator, benzoate and cis,cis-muconate-responsive activator of ben and cat genes
MELRQLRYFLAVARTLNFTKAADEVHIAQPPLSRQIANLEEELGVPLLQRTPRALHLTPAGEFFAEHAREILQRIQRLKDDTAALGDRGVQTVRVGFELSLLNEHAARVMRHLREDFPSVRFEPEVLPAERLLPALRDGEVDIAVGREVSKDAEIEQLVTRTESLVLVFPAGHKRARDVEAGLFLSDLVDEVFVVHSTGAEIDAVKHLCDDAGIPTANRIVLRDISAVLGLVAAGGGIAVVPVIARQLRHNDVVYVPLRDQKAETPVVLSVINSRYRPYFEAMCDESLRLMKLARDGGDQAARQRP